VIRLKKIAIAFLALILVLQLAPISFLGGDSLRIAAAAEADVLVMEESFENPADERWITESSGYDDGEAYTGNHSLKYERSDAAHYKYPQVSLAMEPGETYYATVMLKTENVGAGKARIALEAYDGDDWKGGQYTDGHAPADWTLLKLPTYTVPEDAGRLQVSLYLSQGDTGTVWFDDVKVYKKAPAGSQSGYSTSFEDPDDATWLSGSTSYDAAESRTGEYSLKYTNGPANSSPSFDFNLTPGVGYYVSVWVKTDGVADGDGAKLALDAVDAGGNWIGGSYANPINPGDWTYFRIPLYTAPANGAKANLTLYTQGTTGTVWFDDLTLHEVKPKLIQTRLESPGYRGILLPGTDADIRVRTEAATGADLSAYTIRASLLQEDQSVVEATYLDGSGGDAVFPSAKLAPGTYHVRVEAVLSGTDTAADSEEWTIRKLGSAAEMPKSYVDSEGRFWRNGKLFLPIGIYADKIVRSELEELKNSPINTLLPYDLPSGEQLDLAAEYGKQVIFSLKDFFYGSAWAPEGINSDEDAVSQIGEFVHRFKDYPALLAWYLNDEAPNDDRLPSHYEAVKANDPNHPAYTVDFHLPSASVLAKTTDIFGLDVYPVKGLEEDPIGEPGELQKATTEAIGKKGQWAVVQAQNVGNYGQGGLRPPTEREMRNMAWQYITEGARGILFYSLFDMKNDASGLPYEELLGRVNRVAQEIADLQAFILSDRPADNVRIAEGDGDWLHWMSRKVGDKTYIAMVNNSKEAQRAAIEVPEGMRLKVWNENTFLPISNNRFTGSYSPLDVQIYELSAKSGSGGGTSNPDPGSSSGTDSGPSTGTEAPNNPLADLEQELNGLRERLDGAAASEQAAINAQAIEKIQAAADRIGQLDMTPYLLRSNGDETTIDHPALLTRIDSIGEAFDRLRELLRGFSPEAILPARLSMTFGGSSDELQVQLEQAILERLLEKSIAQVTLDWQGVELLFAPSQLQGDVEIRIIRTSDDQQLAAPAYEIELKVNGSVPTEFNPPITLGLPLPTGADLDKELLAMIEFAGGRTEIVGGKLSGENMYAELSRLRSIYAVVENRVEFNDLDRVASWAGRAIQVAAAKGFMSGADNGRFAPESPITRAEWVALLAKGLELGDMDVERDMPVSDAPVTRAELAALAGRAVSLLTGRPVPSGENPQALLRFRDASRIPEEMTGEAALAVSLGIVNGVDAKRLLPEGVATRAQAAVVLYRLMGIR